VFMVSDRRRNEVAATLLSTYKVDFESYRNQVEISSYIMSASFVSSNLLQFALRWHALQDSVPLPVVTSLNRSELLRALPSLFICHSTNLMIPLAGRITRC
jgi:hypothetical protein